MVVYVTMLHWLVTKCIFYIYFIKILIILRIFKFFFAIVLCCSVIMYEVNVWILIHMDISLVERTLTMHCLSMVPGYDPWWQFEVILLSSVQRIYLHPVSSCELLEVYEEETTMYPHYVNIETSKRGHNWINQYYLGWDW